jgi:ribosomal protein L37AE/L43A
MLPKGTKLLRRLKKTNGDNKTDTEYNFQECPKCKGFDIKYLRYFNVQIAMCKNCSWTVQVQGKKKDLIEEWNMGDYYR